MNKLNTLILALISFCCLSASAALTNQHTLYIDPNGNDSTGKKGLKEFPFKTGYAASLAALPGDTIAYSAGTFRETNAIQCPTNGAIVGAGKRATVILSYADNTTLIPLITPSDNGLIQGITVSNFFGDPDNIHFGACIGTHFQHGIATSYTNALLQDLELWGGSDTFYNRHTNKCTAAVRNCDLHGTWDIVTLFGSGQHQFSFYSCTFSNTQVTAHNNGKDCIVFNATVASKTNSVFCQSCVFSMTTTVSEQGFIIGDADNSFGQNNATLVNCVFDNRTLQNNSGDGSFSENTILTFAGCKGLNVLEVGNADEAPALVNYETNVIGTVQFGGQRHKPDGPRITSGYTLETGRDLSFLSDSNLFAGLIIGQKNFLVRSNTLASLPILQKGDACLWSSNGILFSINSSPAGVLTTNKLAP